MKTVVKQFQPEELFEMFKLKDASSVSKLLNRLIKVFESVEVFIPDKEVKVGKAITHKEKYNKALTDLKKLRDDGGKLKDMSDSERILSSLVNLFVYLKDKDCLQTSVANFSKIAPDLIFVDTNLEENQIVDSLEKRRVIKFPV